MIEIEPTEAARRVYAGEEIALLDVREAGPFSMGHPLFAVPAPFSRLELCVGQLVPRRATAIVLIDGGDDVARSAAERLEAMGYRDVAIVAGGAPRWEASGETLYRGVNVPSKALGELAEVLWHPATVDAQTLAAWQDGGQPFHLFDVRPASEHAKMRVPGARCLPNGELAHRFDAAVEGDAPVVVACAGRTRGLIGALGLRIAGIDRPVFALTNGTQGWALAGNRLERGNTAEPFPELDAPRRAATTARADALLERQGLVRVDAAAVRAMLGETGRTTYLLDVRSDAEVAADPLPAFVHAPSGQLVQATDQWVGVRHARLVLADDGGLRAGIAAFWLRALGYEAVVADADEMRSIPAATVADASKPAGISPQDALARLVAGACCLDVRASSAFRKGHVAGARWSIRPRAAQDAGAGEVLVVADEPRIGALVVDDLVRLGRRAALVEGGHRALVSAGAAVETSDAPADLEAPDVTWFAHGRHDGDLDASRLYLDWEQGLIEQLSAAEREAFRLS